MVYLLIAWISIGFILHRLLTPLIKKISAAWKHRRNRTMELFERHYLDVRALYLREWNIIPCISCINNVDPGKMYAYAKSGEAGKVVRIYQRNLYNWQHQQNGFTKTIFQLENKVMIVIEDEWVEILFPETAYGISNRILDVCTTFRSVTEPDKHEIHIITTDHGGLDLKPLDIKPSTLDVNLYYNDDFAAVHNVIQERLAKQNDKGIVLLHGLPGTGKTTYLRYLIGNLQKKVLFVSPNVAADLTNPGFIDLLIDNPNSVLVIEDAENIIMDRKFSSNSSVSNLLNISDGLLSDCLNVQIICTFNSALNMVDSALLRKGRLIAKYEFGKLDTSKAQALSDHLSLGLTVTKPMTLAEITHANELDYDVPQVQVIGFRREIMMEN